MTALVAVIALSVGLGIGFVVSRVLDGGGSSTPAGPQSTTPVGSPLSGLPSNWPADLPVPANGHVSLTDDATLDGKPTRSVVVVVGDSASEAVLSAYRSSLAAANVRIASEATEPDAKRMNLATQPPVTVRVGAVTGAGAVSVVFYLPR
jgi:hypothetical protein